MPILMFLLMLIFTSLATAAPPAAPWHALQGIPATPMTRQAMEATTGKSALTDFLAGAQQINLGGGATLYYFSSTPSTPVTINASWNTGSSSGSTLVTFPR